MVLSKSNGLVSSSKDLGRVQNVLLGTLLGMTVDPHLE